VIIGLVQCVALIPGVSRAGATISAGMLRDLVRVAATRLAFFSPFRLWLPPGEPDVDTIEHSANASPCRLSAANADGES
jgi:bacitracin resistance protein BacA